MNTKMQEAHELHKIPLPCFLQRTSSLPLQKWQREEELYKILIHIRHYTLDTIRSKYHTCIPTFVDQS